MYEEINLRPYLQALISKWKWIVGITIVAAIFAFLGSLFIAPTYEATALIAITAPRQLVQFDPRFESTSENQPLRAYPELAMSDALLIALQTQLPNKTENEASLEELRKMLSANSGEDLSLVRLAVTHPNAVRTGEIANLWAALFVATANEIYGDQSETQVQFFEDQREQATKGLAAAEDALIEFEARNKSSIINNQLNALRQTHNDYLSNQRDIIFLIRDIEGLRTYLASSLTSKATLSDQLTALLLQIAASSSLSPTPIQLQISSAEALGNLSKSEQIVLLEAQLDILHEVQIETTVRLQELEPQILDLQRQLQESDVESNLLKRNKTLAEETFTALSRKVEEERITSQDTSSGVRLAGQAVVPEKPVGPRRLLLTAVAGVLGFFLSALFVLLMSWWATNREAS